MLPLRTNPQEAGPRPLPDELRVRFIVEIKTGVTIMIRTVLLVIGISITLSSQAESSNDQLLGLLAASKMAGLCGAVQQMARFQESTKLKGGDDFIYRFVGTETARLGMDHATFLKRCEQAITTYDGFVKAVEDRPE